MCSTLVVALPNDMIKASMIVLDSVIGYPRVMVFLDSYCLVAILALLGTDEAWKTHEKLTCWRLF
jgi:hypothetical protein